MENKIKCFSEEHKEIDAIYFCPECRIYMCNKCEKYHSPFFKNHHPYNLNKEDEIFTGFCKEKNHPIKLEYFCKDHNQLCCGLCIAKLKEKGEGQHKDCNICYIENITEEKKIKLKENIKCLEDLEKKFNESMESLKQLFQSIEKDKENLKQEIQKVFTKIRTVLNEREDELLLEVDKLYNSKYFNEDIIKKGEKLPKQIKLSLEKGKLIDKEWNSNNLYSNINDCINIENNIKYINTINENIKRCDIRNDKKLKFVPSNNLLDKFLDTIKLFGKIYSNNYTFKDCPTNIDEKRIYTVTGDNKNILTKTGTDNYYCGTICENELDRSIEEHKWKIKILKTKKKEIYIGVASIDFKILSDICKTDGRFLCCSNSRLYSGPPFNYSYRETNLSKMNDEIIIVMNMQRRALRFIINGEDKGDSFTNIPIDKPICPVVVLLHQGDSIEIIEC